MIEKIYTVTPCIWQSYGSMLQALGLQKKIISMGYENAIIKCEPAPQKQLERKQPKATNLKRWIVNFHKKMIYMKLNQRYTNSNRFMKDHIKIEYFDNYEKLRQNPPKAKAYIAGSDQIWNPLNMQPFWYLDFAKSAVRRISYAASMGVTEVQEEKKERFKQYISTFDFVSVREKDSVPVISRCTDKTISVNIDPVFLLNKDEWKEYEEEYPGMQSPYLLVFAIYWDRKLNEKLKKIHKKNGIDIVAVSSGMQRVYANKRIYDADPAQFLWLIDHANAVVTSSFHGVSMSIICQKKFSAVINPSAPSRIACLLDTLEVQNLEFDELFSDTEQDYGKINCRIKEEQRKSEEYLMEALRGI